MDFLRAFSISLFVHALLAATLLGMALATSAFATPPAFDMMTCAGSCGVAP